MARGGKRVARSRRAYQNRTDMAKPHLHAVEASPSVYGQGESMRRSQQIIPVAAGNASPGPPVSAPAPAAVPPTGPGQGPQPPPLGPEHLPPLDAPTDRPEEDLLTGVAQPGQPAGPTRPFTVSDQIASLTGDDPSGEMAALAQFARSRGL